MKNRFMGRKIPVSHRDWASSFFIGPQGGCAIALACFIARPGPESLTLRRAIPLLLVSLLATSCVAAPTSISSLNYEAIWERSLVRGDYQVPRAVIRTSDNGYAVAGYGLVSLVEGGIGAGPGFWTVKLDRNGKVQWQRAFAAEAPKGLRREEASVLTETHDGGLLVVGETQSDALAGMELGVTTDPSSGSRAQVGFAIKYDREGRLIWKKSLNATKDRPYDIFYAVLSVSDGFVLAATAPRTILNPETPNGTDTVDTIRIIKLDDSGHTLWDRNYVEGESSIQYGRMATKIISTSNGGFIIAVAPSEEKHNETRRMDVVDDTGKSFGKAMLQRAVILKFDRDGRILKRAEFPAATKHLTLGANANGYLVSGYHSFLWYAFFDRDLNLKWKKTVPEGIRINALWAAPDDSFYGIGAATSTAIAHISPSGEISQDTISGTASGSEGRDIAPGDRPDEFVFLWSRIPQTRAGIIKVLTFSHFPTTGHN